MNKTSKTVLILAISLISSVALGATPSILAQEIIYPLNSVANKLHIFVLLLCWFFWVVMLIWLMRGLKQWRNNNPAGSTAGTLAFVTAPILLGAILLAASSWVVYRWQGPIDPQLSINIVAYHGPDNYDYTWKSSDSPVVHKVFNEEIFVKQNALTYIDISTKLNTKSHYRKTWARIHNLFPEFAHIAKFTPTKTGTFAINCKYNCSVDDNDTPIHVTVFATKQINSLNKTRIA